ncbi:hypothetical protein Ddc_14134 [Ditylenchus destructor]|nr:hypothetical protein Ddc_14134 [Ditylenchus destructor]
MLTSIFTGDQSFSHVTNWKNKPKSSEWSLHEDKPMPPVMKPSRIAVWSLRRLFPSFPVSRNALLVFTLFLCVILFVNIGCDAASLSMREMDDYMAPYVDAYAVDNGSFQPESLRLKKWASQLRFGKRAANNGWASQVRFG